MTEKKANLPEMARPFVILSEAKDLLSSREAF
jgi:hypothetical protein